MYGLIGHCSATVFASASMEATAASFRATKSLRPVSPQQRHQTYYHILMHKEALS